MENWSQLSSNPEDPLLGYSDLSLFPRTLKSLANTLARPHESEDLQHTHNVFKSMPFKFQNETLEQVKCIVASSSEFLNPTMPRNVEPGDENRHVEGNPIPSQRERRLGLGGKRARFSFKPTKNINPTAITIPSFDVRKNQNPEDFFSEFEKFENAKKEWQKQIGLNLVDADQNQRSTRPRRPGISGRKQVKYKHLYSTDAISQRTSEGEILCSPDHSFQEQTTIAHVTSPHQDLAGSTKNKDKSVDELLGELLSCTQGELDGDGAVNLLEERLQIKPVDIGKLCLPELQDVKRIDLKTSRKSLSKPKTEFLDIQNMVKAIRSQTSPKNNETSPLLKSPLSSIPWLLKQKSRLNQQNDQFTFPITSDLSAADVSSTSTSILNFDIAGPSVKSASNSLIGNDSSIHASLEGPHASVEGNEEDESLDESPRKRDSSRDKIDVDIPTVEPNHNDHMVEDVPKRDMAAEQNDHSGKTSTPERLNDITSQFDEALGEIESPKHAKAAQEQRSAEDETCKSADGVQEQNNGENGSVRSAEEAQEQNEKMPKPSQNGTKKRSQTLSRESKALSRRKSLAAAGTSWEAGVRRSKRIRSRPLEYWKGERFLYGRIHESLTTVIGIKYVSPAKGKGNPAMLKVKSFVSDEHKELLEAAALH